MARLAAFVVALTLVAAACGDSGADPAAVPDGAGGPPVGPGTTAPVTVPPAAAGTEPAAPLQGLALEPVARRTVKPIQVTAPPGDPRLFVVEQDGRIRIVADGIAREFLDIAADVGSGGLEQGLLGLAFHPDYASNGRFFVNVTNNDGHTEIREYRVSDDPDVADLFSKRTLLTVPQPAANHNGGMVQFGPDGYLYISLGDGGGANDQFGNGPRPDTLLGTILRLDVDAAQPYAVPPDNPFIAGGGAPEVWAYGLRNPWRFSIDATEGLLYIGDVGQAAQEEVDVAPLDAAGLDYGWSTVEGDECFQSEGCDLTASTAPALVYGRADGCSVIGGHAYRGAAIPELAGHYFYSDWCGGWVRSFRYQDGEVVDERDWSDDFSPGGRVLSFGVDASGELYLTVDDGSVYRIVPRR